MNFSAQYGLPHIDHLEVQKRADRRTYYIDWLIDENVIDHKDRDCVCRCVCSARYPHPPIITESPQNQSVRVGGTARFTCRFLSDSSPYIQWLKHIEINGSYVNEVGDPYFQVISVRWLPLTSTGSQWFQLQLYCTVALRLFTRWRHQD